MIDHGIPVRKKHIKEVAKSFKISKELGNNGGIETICLSGHQVGGGASGATSQLTSNRFKK